MSKDNNKKQFVFYNCNIVEENSFTTYLRAIYGTAGVGAWYLLKIYLYGVKDNRVAFNAGCYGGISKDIAIIKMITGLESGTIKGFIDYLVECGIAKYETEINGEIVEYECMRDEIDSKDKVYVFFPSVRRDIAKVKKISENNRYAANIRHGNTPKIKAQVAKSSAKTVLDAVVSNEEYITSIAETNNISKAKTLALIDFFEKSLVKYVAKGFDSEQHCVNAINKEYKSNSSGFSNFWDKRQKEKTNVVKSELVAINNDIINSSKAKIVTSKKISSWCNDIAKVENVVNDYELDNKKVLAIIGDINRFLDNIKNKYKN